MSIYIYNGTSWDECLDPSVYTSSGWVDIMEGHTYIGNNVWNRFFVRLTPVTPTVNNVSRTTNSLTFSYSHPGHSSGVYLVLKLVRVSDGATIAGPENTALTSGSISANKTYTGLTNGVQYRFEAYAVYNAYNINSDTATTSYTTLTFIPVEPNLSFSSATISSITVSATLPAQSPHYAQITVYRTTNALGASLIPASATTSSISGTKTETGLSVNTSYEFSAYTSYYDAPGGNFLAISDTVTETFSTLNYLLTTPTKPTNSDRQINSLKFKSSSNANYARNGSYYTANAYIEFTLYRASNNAFVAIQTASLSNNDILTEKEVEFTGLSTGVEYYCRARTYYYSPVSAYSSYSENSADTSTLDPTPTKTPQIAANNTTYLTGRTITASSVASGFPAPNASDGLNSTSWYSGGASPQVYSFIATQVTKTSSKVTYSSPFGAPQPFNNISTATVSSPNNVRMQQAVLSRWTFNSPTGKTTRLNGGSGTIYAAAPGDVIRVDVPVPTDPPGTPGIPGNRTVIADPLTGSNVVRVNVPANVPLNGGYTPVPSGSTIKTFVPGLGTPSPNRPVSSFVSQPLAGISVTIPSSSVPSTRTFTPSTVENDFVYVTASGTVSPSAGGIETLTMLIYPKTSTYEDPRFVSGGGTAGNSFTLSVPDFGNSTRSMDVELVMTDSGGTERSQGTKTVLSNSSVTWSSLNNTIYPRFDNFLNTYYFEIKFLCRRLFISALNANGCAIKEITFNYTYTSYI